MAFPELPPLTWSQFPDGRQAFLGLDNFLRPPGNFGRERTSLRRRQASSRPQATSSAWRTSLRRQASFYGRSSPTSLRPRLDFLCLPELPYGYRTTSLTSDNFLGFAATLMTRRLPLTWSNFLRPGGNFPRPQARLRRTSGNFSRPPDASLAFPVLPYGGANFLTARQLLTYSGNSGTEELLRPACFLRPSGNFLWPSRELLGLEVPTSSDHQKPDLSATDNFYSGPKPCGFPRFYGHQATSSDLSRQLPAVVTATPQLPGNFPTTSPRLPRPSVLLSHQTTSCRSRDSLTSGTSYDHRTSSCVHQQLPGFSICSSPAQATSYGFSLTFSRPRQAPLTSGNFL
ncbi:hypothetical protein FNV43_RR14049 [Rhamnella rubrinervis]|uniref:Uncharacterized protein n=1 Tax=Rhamnella rubrinervis TaxID=2594499 RepID=A0A8K0H295_9ROSA|nr:hypothetical protein FNV43_RR14049 [Rhamnella rubrinervis]